ncbi:MAG: cupin domain-containing protein [Balneolaceae bacterium]|nr:cupin domain-containing protein [Balneolaceae bacterium]
MKAYTYIFLFFTFIASSALAQNQGYVLEHNEGEVLLNGGIIVKASPQQGSQGGEMVLQTMTPGFSTGRHVHLKADEFFYIVDGAGIVVLGGHKEIIIEAGDVVFVPKGHDHKLVNTGKENPLELIFFLDKPGLAETFRKMHQRFRESDEQMTLKQLNKIAKKYGTVFKTLK